MTSIDPVTRKRRWRTPRASYANVAATIALVLALGAGTAFAAHHYMISSTKQIKPSVIKKLRGHRGAVGQAGVSGVTGPTGIGSTGAMGPANHLLEWDTTVATAGASISAPNTVTLETVGPFTISGWCYVNGPDTIGATYVSTSQDGAALSAYDSYEDHVPFNIADGALDVGDSDASGATSSNTPSFYGPDDGSWAVSTASGSTIVNGFGNQGVWLQGGSGPACSFSGYLVYQ
jgi:hypothetical protein